ncbi:MAG: hypothetical protein ACUVTB_07130 [Candidatus Bathycorpusculaceae bacterium]
MEEAKPTDYSHYTTHLNTETKSPTCLYSETKVVVFVGEYADPLKGIEHYVGNSLSA